MLTAHEVEVFTALRNAIYMLETDGRNGKRRALDALYLIKYSFEPLMRDAAPPAAAVRPAATLCGGVVRGE